MPGSLFTYSKHNFTVGGTRSNKILVFDVDDTLIHTTANVRVMRDGVCVRTITSKEYNNYQLSRDEYFDFQEFNDRDILYKEKFTRYWEILKHEYKRGTHISILTARDDCAMIRDFLSSNGVDIKKCLVFAVGDPALNLTGTIQHRKSTVIKWLTHLGYNIIVFFDDDDNNLKQVQRLKIAHSKIYTIKT